MKYSFVWMGYGLLVLLLSACAGESGATTPYPRMIEMGKAVYNTNCVACHGVKGEGEPNWKIPDANGVYPAPPHDSSGHTWHHADALLLQVIREGSGMPNSKMSVYVDILSADEIEAVLAYIKTFWGAEAVAFQQQMNAQWKEQNK